MNNFLTEFSKEYLYNLGLDKSKLRLKKVYIYFYVNDIEPTVENFRNLSDSDFARIRDIGDATAIKLKWLRDFLNGKVDGKYEEQTAKEADDVRRLKQIILGKNEKIHELIRKNNELREEIIEIKRENKKLRKNDITIEKLKKFLNNA